MADSISNTHGLIDSRDVIKRIEELTEERDDLQAAIDEAREELSSNPAGEEIALASVISEREQALADWNDDYGDELKALAALADGAEGYSGDWNHGATLIRDSYFERCAQELAEDLHGDRIRNAEWPLSCIDWEKAATELQQDYTSVDFDGVDYWVR